MITYNTRLTDDERFLVEAIKLSVKNVPYKQLSMKELLCASIAQLYEYYQQYQKKEYLEVALLQIQAYLELGFSYEEKEDLFRWILNEAEVEKSVKFPRKFFSAKEFGLKKNEIRSMIKRWQGSPKQELKIGQVVDDIMKKISNREYGIHYYRNSVTGELYELLINEQEILFHDLQSGLFYVFKE